VTGGPRAETSSRPSGRTVRGLAPGTKIGLGVSAVLVVWGTVTLYWPATADGPAGSVVQCGSAASARGDEACSTQTGRLRLQAAGLYAAAAVVGVTAGAVFGTRPVSA
jgi:hypothetical protein